MVVWKLVPPDPELTYVSMAVDKATWDSFDSYEEFFEKYVLKQGEGTYSAEDLSADSDYIVYAYGMDAAGNILTDIYIMRRRGLFLSHLRMSFSSCRWSRMPKIGR